MVFRFAIGNGMRFFQNPRMELGILRASLLELEIAVQLC